MSESLTVSKGGGLRQLQDQVDEAPTPNTRATNPAFEIGAWEAALEGQQPVSCATLGINPIMLIFLKHP